MAAPVSPLYWHQDLAPIETAIIATKSSAVLAILERTHMTLSCYLACRLWARVFVKRGLGVTFAQGFYEDIEDGERELIGHAWLELPSGAIFDPTAAQFSSPGDAERYLLTDSEEIESFADLLALDSITL